MTTQPAPGSRGSGERFAPAPRGRRAPRVRSHALGLIVSLALGGGLEAQTTTGFHNLARAEAPGTLLSHPAINDSIDIGRTTTVQYLRGWVIVGGEAPGSRSNSDLELRVYDIEDPTNPVRMLPSDFGLSYTNDSWHQGNFGWNAHGSAQVEEFLFPNTIRVLDWGGTVERGGNGVPRAHVDFPFGGWNRSAQAGPWYSTMKWYGSADSSFEITKRIPNGGGFTTKSLATFEHNAQFGGGDWHPMFFGDLLIYARSGSSDQDGIVIYRLIYNDFDDPQNMSVTPQFVATLDARFQGYWPVFFSDGQGLYVVNAASNLIMAADISEVADPNGDGTITKLPELVTSISNAQYPVFQDQYAFIHDKKVDMSSFIAGDSNPIVLDLDEIANACETSQMSLPLGNLWLTGGYNKSNGRSQGMGVWVQQQAPDTTAPKVTYHIPQAGRTNYPRWAPLSFLIHEVPKNGGPVAGEDFLVRKVNPDETLGSAVAGHSIFDMSGVLTFTPDAGLEADATYQVDFVADPVAGHGFVDAAGNYIEPYSFRFSTGSGVAGDPPPTIDSVVASNFQPLPGESVTITVNATTVANPEFRFNFDGTWGPWGGSNSASASYAAEGRERVLVQVRDDSGFSSTGTAQLVVIAPPAGTPGTHSRTLAIGDDGGARHLWVVNPDADTVAVLDPASGAKLDEVAVGEDPRGIARDGNGRYWVACHDSDELQLLAWNAGSQVAYVEQVIELPYGSGPFGVCASPDGQHVYVSYQSAARLARFAIADPLNPAVIDSVPTPRAIAVSGDGGRVFVTRFISPELEAEVGEYESNGATFAHKRTITLGYSQVSDSGDRAAGVPNYLTAIAISPDGGHALVASKQDNVQRGDLFAVGDLTHETSVRAIVSVIDLATNKELPNSRRDFDNSEGPSAIDFTPLGDMALLTLRGNNTLVGIDALDLGADVNVSAAVTLEVATGLAPEGVLVDPLGDRVFTQDLMGRSVSVFDGAPLLDQNQTSLPPLAVTGTVANELLSATVLEGKRVFYNAADERMSAESYISCATCHLDGGHDGRVWDFTGRGEGLRRTTDLRGRAGTGHGNVHWSGNFDEIQDFEHDIRGPFAGLGFLPIDQASFDAQHPDPSSAKAGLSPELDALAAYVASLAEDSVPRSPHRNADGSITADGLLGKAVFDSMNCASCHSGEAFTDSVVSPVASASLHDVGTLSSLSGKRLGGGPLVGVDTPTLLGTHAASGLLHHGLADSVDAVFDFAGGEVLSAAGTEEIWTLNDVVSPKSDNASDGGGGNSRGSYDGDWVQVKKDKESTDVNGNGQIDTYESGIRFTDVDGGSGGPARLAIRYVVGYGNTPAIIRVNGVDTPVTLERQQTDGGWKIRGWRWIAIETSLNAGSGNVVELIKPANSSRDISYDVMVGANADALALADPHRQVRALPAADRAHLVAWLLQLDGRDPDGNLGPDLEPATLVEWEFADGDKTPGEVPPTMRDQAIAAGVTVDIGPGLVSGNGNSYYASDAFAVTRANETSLAGAVADGDYITWTLTPAPGRVIGLGQLLVGVFDQVGSDSFNYQLRVSTDPANFDANHQIVGLSPDGINGQPGTGLGNSSGIAAGADLSGEGSLQGLGDGDVVGFRLYLWNTGTYNGIGVGKLGAAEVDLRIDGGVDGGAMPNTVPEVAPLVLADADEGQPYAATASASGGEGTLLWSLASAPAWLSIDPLSGVLSGTPGAADAGTVGVTVEVTDIDGDSDTASADLTVIAAPVLGPKLAINVWDGTNALSPEDGWVNSGALALGYDDPVIVANLTKAPGQPSAVVMVRPVAGVNNEYELKVVQTTNNPAPAEDYAVTVLVAEAGAYDGWEAASYQSTRTDRKGFWAGERVDFENGYTEPVVFGQVMVPAGTDPDWSVFWSARDNGGSLSRTNPANGPSAFIGKHVGEDPNQTRPDATLGYFVIERGAVTLDGHAAFAGKTGDTVKEIDQGGGPETLDLAASGLSGVSAAIAGTIEMDGGDGGWAILAGPNPVSGLQVTVAFDEDDLGDTDNRHTSETVGVLIIE